MNCAKMNPSSQRGFSTRTQSSRPMSSKQFLYDIDHDEDDEGAHLDEEYGSALTGHNFACAPTTKHRLRRPPTHTVRTATGFKVTKKRNAKAAKRQQSAQARAQSQKQQVRAAFLAVCQLEADAMLPYFKYSRDVLGSFGTRQRN